MGTTTRRKSTPLSHGALEGGREGGQEDEEEAEEKTGKKCVCVSDEFCACMRAHLPAMHLTQ